MENKKTILISALVAAFISGWVFLVLFMLFDFRPKGKDSFEEAYIEKKESKPIGLTSQSSSPAGSNQAPNIVSDKEKIPEIVTGTVESVEGRKILIKQFASVDLFYELGKGDFSSVVTVRKNPQFDERKVEQKRKELEDKIKLQTNSNASTQNVEADKKKLIDNQVPETDLTLMYYLEEKIAFESIEKGSQVNVIKDEKGTKKLVVFPKEINIGPPSGSRPGGE